MSGTRRTLGASAGVLGVLAAVAGRPAPNATTIDVRALAGEIDRQTDHVDAIELAAWIRDRKRGLRVLDVRSESEFAAYHIPSAEHVPLARIVGMRPRDGETLVLYSEGGAHAGQAWVLLRALGFRTVCFLRGGLLDWMDDVMTPTVASNDAGARVAALSRYFGGTPRHADATAGTATDATMPATPAASAGAASAVARLRRRGC